MNSYRVYSAPKGEDQFFVQATSGPDAILAVRKYLSNPDGAKAYWLPRGAKIDGPHRFKPAPCNTTYSK